MGVGCTGYKETEYYKADLSFLLLFTTCMNFFSPIGGHSIQRPLTTTKARSGDLFIMGAPDRQVTFTPYEGTDSFTSMPYPGFEPGTLGVAVGSPIHYTSWSAF